MAPPTISDSAGKPGIIVIDRDVVDVVPVVKVVLVGIMNGIVVVAVVLRVVVKKLVWVTFAAVTNVVMITLEIEDVAATTCVSTSVAAVEAPGELLTGGETTVENVPARELEPDVTANDAVALVAVEVMAELTTKATLRVTTGPGCVVVVTIELPVNT